MILDLNVDIPWKELVSGIKPRSYNQDRYSLHGEAALAVWDVLRVALMWRILCARCRIVFGQEPFTFAQTCQLEWNDTIYVGMARIKYFKQDFAHKDAECQKNIASKFVQTWCRKDVFCSTVLAPKWKFILVETLCLLLCSVQ